MAVEEILTPDVPDDTVVAPVVAPDAGQLPSVAPDAGPFRLSFSPQQFSDLWETYTVAADAPKPLFDNAAQGFASSLVDTLVFDPFYKGKMDYNSLRMGTAPILAELGIEGGVSDVQIIELFSEDEEGNDIIADPTFFEGLKRRTAGGAGGGGGFFAGMAAGNLMVAGIPPFTPWTAAVRLGVPVLTGIAGYAAGSFAGDKLTEEFMGREPIMIPGRGSADYEAGKATADAAAFIITPWTAPAKGANLGANILLNNTKNFIGPIVGSRTPLPTRIVAGVENLTATMGTAARTNPFRTGAMEVGATALGGFGVQTAETVAPGNPWIRFGFETVGGVTGAMATDLAVNRVPKAVNWAGSGVYNLFKRMTGRAPIDEMQARYGLSKEQIRAGGAFIIEQLEKNAEDPAEILRLLNDSSFDKWLVDPEGQPITLDAATQTASLTLLSLQNQFIDAAPQVFGDGAVDNTQAAVEALRRALLAMYADGSKEALSDAALLQTSLFSEVLDAKLAKAFIEAQEAMRRVRPEGDNVDLEAANDIFTFLDRQYTADRREESLLWKLIPQDIEVTSFVNEDGVTQEVPNFILKWEALLGDETPEIREAILKNEDLKLLAKFVARKTEELGLGDVRSQFPEVPEQRRLIAALDQIAGTPNAQVPQNFVESQQLLGTPLDDIVKGLRSQADETPDKELARALNAQANLLVSQERQALEFAEAAAKQTETAGVNAQELVRTRGRALAAARRLAAGGFSEEARIANEMADALLADLNSMDINVSQPYNTARSFSRAFNNVYGRTYAGDVLGTKKNGAPKIPIETMASRMMSGDAAFMRTAQLDGIAQFQVTQSLTNLLRADNPDLPGLEKIGATLLNDFKKNVDPQSGVLDMDLMRAWYGRNAEVIKSIPGLNTRIASAMNGSVQLRSAEETLLRTIRANALNPDGTLNVGALSNWRNNANNERLLDLFPSLKADLDNVDKAASLLTQTRIDNEAAELAERQAVGLYELLPNKTTNAATAIALAISPNNPKPFPDMNRLMRLITEVGEDGFIVASPSSPNAGLKWSQQDLMDGMRTAIYDTVLKAGADGKSFSPAAAFNRLFVNHPNADISLAEWMRSNDLVSVDQLEDIQTFLRKMAQIEVFRKKATPADTDAFYADMGEGIKLLSAMGGALAGSSSREAVGMSGPGLSLLASQRGASLGNRLANKYAAELPQSLQADRIGIILQNPELLQQVLKTGRTAREKDALVAQLEQMLITNYVISPTRRAFGEGMQITTDETFNDSGATVIPPVGGPPNVAPNVAPNVRPVTPRVDPNTPTNPTRPLASTPPSGPVDRAKFAALFPEDRELMGIGSLMEGRA